MIVICNNRYIREDNFLSIPEGTYKFRVAAVYQNNDNKHGPTSKKFTLQTAPYSEPQAPEGAPVIVEVKPVEFQNKHGLNVKWNVSLSKRFYIRFSLKAEINSNF